MRTILLAFSEPSYTAASPVVAYMTNMHGRLKKVTNMSGLAGFLKCYVPGLFNLLAELCCQNFALQ